MKIAHVSDVHIGFRTYGKRNAAGMNQREVDVARAFRRIVDDLIEWRPDLVVYPGDFFDTSAPTMAVLAFVIEEVMRLHSSGGAPHQVFVGGNHDHPRFAQDGHPFQVLAKALPVISVINEPEVVEIREIDTAVMCLPHGTYNAERMLESAETADKLVRVTHKVLVVHAPIEVRGENRLLYARMSGDSIPAEILRPERWTYVAAGDFHEYLAFADNAAYAGSIEYVNAGPWIEARDEAPGKGYIRFDTERPRSERLEFVGIETRAVFDAEPIECEPSWTGEDLTEVMLSRIWELPGEEGRIIRQRVQGASQELWSSIDWQAIQDVKGHELHYHPVREPIVSRSSSEGLEPLLPSNPTTPSTTITEEMETFVDGWDPGAGVDREKVKTYAADRLSAAEEDE